MTTTPPDRADRPQRRFRHGPYRAVVWGNTINVHYGDDTASPIYSKTMKGQIGDANMSELARQALPEIAKDHEIKMAKENAAFQASDEGAAMRERGARMQAAEDAQKKKQDD